jgi:hypothetical protein
MNQASTLTTNHYIYFKSADLMNQTPTIISEYPLFSAGFLANH